MQKLHGRKLKEGLFVYLMLAYPLLQFLFFTWASILFGFTRFQEIRRRYL